MVLKKSKKSVFKDVIVTISLIVLLFIVFLVITLVSSFFGR